MTKSTKKSTKKSTTKKPAAKDEPLIVVCCDPDCGEPIDGEDGAIKIFPECDDGDELGPFVQELHYGCGHGGGIVIPFDRISEDWERRLWTKKWWHRGIGEALDYVRCALSVERVPRHLEAFYRAHRGRVPGHAP